MEYKNVYNTNYLKALKSNIASLQYRVEIVDWTEENILYDITNKLISGTGNLSINYQQGVRRSFSFDLENVDKTFSPSAETGILYVGTKFKLIIGVNSIDKKDIYWWDQGIFVISDAGNKINSGGKIVSVQSTDKFGMFGAELGYSQLIGDYKIESGTLIYDVFRDILSTDMENGYILDYKVPYLDPLYADEVMPYTLTKSKGSYIGDILIELANVLGSNIFYDRSGHLNISSGTEDVSYSQKGVLHNFEEEDLEVGDINVAYSYKDVVNSVTVIGTNINDKIYSHTAQNNNPFSNTRIELIGLKEASPIESAMVYSDERAEEFSIYKLNNMSILQSNISIISSVIPHLEVDEVITVTKDYYNFMYERFIIQELSFSIDFSSPMTISCCNVSELPYYELESGGE